MENTVKKQKPVSAILSLIFGILTYLPVNIVPLLFPILAISFGNRSIARSQAPKLGKAGKLLGVINLIMCAVFAFLGFLWVSLHWNTILGWVNALL